MKLNKAQQQVIDHDKGPLLVVAGAGTGKTRVIVEKINKLLNEGIKPEQILALTFTEKAASEMLDRILENQSGFLLEMPVMTFNGYGDSLLKEFGMHIGLPRSFRILGEQAKIIFVRERIDSFDFGNFLPLTASPDGIIEDLLKHISKLKQLLINAEGYKKAVQKLPESDEAEQDYKKQQLTLAGIYETYQALIRQENVIDYDDQIALTVQLLKANPSVRRKLQQRYHTIFVDEFQDTNPMQSHMIDLLTSKKQNLVVVGDDDQSIYGFRGATIANILDFKKRYPKAKEIALTENYRSGQAILDASYNLIQHNNPHRLETSLGINKQLTSDKPGDYPQIMRFASKEHELNWLAENVKARLDNLAADRPVSMAVLTRSNSAAKAVHQALLSHGIAHRVVGLNSDLYETPIVRSLLELTRSIAEPDNNLSLHHTLISPVFNIPNSLILPLAAKAKYQHQNLWDLCHQHKDKALALALKVISSARQNAFKPIGRVLYQVLEESGYKDRLLQQVTTDPDSEASITQLGQFFATLKEFEKIAIQPSLPQYLASLPALRAAGESIDDTLDISEDEVMVTTIHKAKGLEWDTVYIPRLTNRSFPMREMNAGFDLPPELLKCNDNPASQHLAEERRVMYVAATRARQQLVLSFVSKEKLTGKKSDASPFINEMFGENFAEKLPISQAGTDRALFEAPHDTDHKTELPRSIFNGKTIKLNVSQAQNLLSCPLNFKYKFILGMPEPPTTSTGYGTQLHNYFEEINLGRSSGTLRPLTEITKELEQSFDRSGYASKKQLEQALFTARNTLSRFYEDSAEGEAASHVEYPFEIRLPGDIVLNGRIDAIFGEGADAHIVDYKTGDRVKDEVRAKANASRSQQLTMYALAWQQITGNLPKKVSLIYPDTKQIGSVSKRQQSLDSLQEKLQRLVNDMRNKVYTPGTNHDYCIHPPII